MSVEAELARVRQRAIVQALRDRPDTTLDEIAKLARGKHGADFEDISLGQLLAFDVSVRRRRAPSGGASPNMRTAQGRRDYDQVVLAFLAASGDWMSAEQLRAEAGGSADQARRSLTRLLEMGKVKRKGVARATRYRAR